MKETLELQFIRETPVYSLLKKAGAYKKRDFAYLCGNGFNYRVWSMVQKGTYYQPRILDPSLSKSLYRFFTFTIHLN